MRLWLEVEEENETENSKQLWCGESDREVQEKDGVLSSVREREGGREGVV